MVNNNKSSRRSITFKQANGIDPLPTQMKTGQLSKVAKAKFWHIINNVIDIENLGAYHGLTNEAVSVFGMFFIENESAFADELPHRASDWKTKIKTKFRPTSLYSDALQFVEFIAREGNNFKKLRDDDLHDTLALVFEEENLGYRLIDASVVVFASPEEHKILSESLDLLSQAGFEQARHHLICANQHLTNGAWSDSVRESIHSVESIARKLTKKTKFSDAIQELNKLSPMHKAFIKAVNSLYGYSSDAEGIRHPLVDEKAAVVDEETALYMASSCAAFVSYIVRKYV